MPKKLLNSKPVASSERTVIRIQDLEFSYPKNQPVLKIASLNINAGERIFLFGPSGSGKTTFLSLLAGILTPQRGAIEILNTDLVTLTSSERDRFRGTHMGYVFQMFNLIPYLNVIQNIMLSAELNPERRKKITVPLEEKARELAVSLGLDAVLKKQVTKLSVGQQQRVAVARALLGSPEIIIADEPTSALDYDHREKFLQMLFEQCEKSGATVVFVSHDRQLESLFDRCVSLKEVNSA